MPGKAKKKTQNTKCDKRYDSDGRVLHSGEIQLKSGTYRFKRTVQGQEYLCHAKTLAELREKEQELSLEIADGISSNSNSATVDMVFKMWFSTKRGISPKSKEDYGARYVHYIKEQFGSRKIKTIKKQELKRYYNQLFDNGLSISTIEAANQVFHQLFVEAIENKYLRDDPTVGVLKDLKREAKSKKAVALTKEQLRIVLESIKNHKNHHHYVPFFTFLVETGLRVGEASGLQWSDIDFEHNRISVTRSLGVLHNPYRLVMHDTKTESGNRIVPMSQTARQMLLAEQAKKIPCQVNIDGFTDFVFLNSRGGAYHQNTLNRVLKEVVDDYNATVTDQAMKLPHITCHTFRHTCITAMVEDGMNLSIVQKIAGHADYRTTANIYTHISDETAAEAMEKREKVQNQKNDRNADFVPNCVPISEKAMYACNNIVLLPLRYFSENA